MRNSNFLIICFFAIFAISAKPFEMMDRNKDGQLSSIEFKGPKPAFKKLDKNGDGFITRREAMGSKLMQDRTSPDLKKKQPEKEISSSRRKLQWIDTHNHLNGSYKAFDESEQDYEGALKRTVESMDRCGIRISIIMPTPQTIEQHGLYTADDFLKVLKKNPGRFRFLAGGGTLNRMIQECVKKGKVTEEDKEKFKKKAEYWVEQGARGFGEMTAEHWSFNPRHPYISAPPDHELFLLLADISAKTMRPIDMHMEAIYEDMLLPNNFQSPPNPSLLKANMPGFERLLEHNRLARIVWVHLGWDNTGQRTPEKTLEMLKKHKNLYMSIRIPTELHIKDTPEKSRIMDKDGKLKKEWLAVFKEFPDRFFIGSDEFFMTPKGKKTRHGSTGSIDNTTAFLEQLPEDVAFKIGLVNALDIYNIK